MIRVHQKNDRLIPYQVRDETDTPVQIAPGVDVVFVVSTQGARDAHLIQKRIGDGITIIDSQEGRIEIDLTANDTSLSSGSYRYELLLIDIDGHRYTADQGYFVVETSMTKEVV